jgi:psiF repeat-containing protein
MTTIISRAAAAAIASLIFASAAFAQSTAPAPGAAPAPAKTSSTKARSPESLECSKQADEKGLKGKERKKFRKDCIKEAKDAASGIKKQ